MYCILTKKHSLCDESLIDPTVRLTCLQLDFNQEISILVDKTDYYLCLFDSVILWGNLDLHSIVSMQNNLTSSGIPQGAEKMSISIQLDGSIICHQIIH